MHFFNDLADFSAAEIKELITLSRKLDENPEPRALEGKVLALLFLSPSLRTLASFQSAMVRLGGGTCRFTDLSLAQVSSWTVLQPNIFTRQFP